MNFNAKDHNDGHRDNISVPSSSGVQKNTVRAKEAISVTLNKKSPLVAPAINYFNRLLSMLGESRALKQPHRPYKEILIEVCALWYKYLVFQDGKLKPEARKYRNADQVDEAVMELLIDAIKRYNKQTNNFKYVRSKFPKYMRENVKNFNSLLGKLVNNVDYITDEAGVRISVSQTPSENNVIMQTPASRQAQPYTPTVKNVDAEVRGEEIQGAKDNSPDNDHDDENEQQVHYWWQE